MNVSFRFALRRPCMKKPMSERSYEEQVAAYLEGWGFLAAAAVVAKHAAYVAQSKDWGMKAQQCAKNLQTKEAGR